MERLDLLGLLIMTLNHSMTIVGKLWLAFTILLRMAVIILAGSPIYQDEQERFVCNTLQPGCTNVCYDFFSPVSPLRFWLIQSVSVLLPSAVFSVYVLHKGAELAMRAACRPDVPDFSSGYIVHLFLRTLTEAAFGALHYLFFGFLVPTRFSCMHSPCTSVVDCYVSRPTEKSIMMLFIWVVSVLSFLLSMADLIYSLQGRMSRRPGPAGQEGHAGRAAPGHAGGPGRRPGLRAGEEEGEPAGEGVNSPSGKPAVSRQMELPDEDQSELMSLASDKLAMACRELGSRPHSAATQNSRSRDLTRSEECSLTPGSWLAGRCPSSQLQPPASGSAPHLRTRKSEWV
ncbi:gap junction delta-4 protein [Manis pentadactyla]|uniref:gap junction delta-4 protein n=1 Tax=Manis pentadactyla TaxID=143292 RepID=UPI00255C3B3D|nr:gap junction delta-4 protein [Manis pentadactyla]